MQVALDEHDTSFFNEEMGRIDAAAGRVPVTAALLRSAKSDIEGISTDSVIYDFVSKVTAAAKPVRRHGRKIKVQPTLARCRIGLPRGSGPVAAGRPTTKKKKRVHSLSDSIKKGVPGAKCH